MKKTKVDKRQRSVSPKGYDEKKEEIIPGKPLDFSFLKIENLEELKQMDPRAGKRKPILKEEKKQNKTELGDNDGNSNVGVVEEKKRDIIKLPPTETRIQVMTKQYDVPLTISKTGGGKVLEENKGVKKKKIINRECNSLLLGNNSLVTISHIKEVLDTVMYSPENLQWLDLSFNQLRGIDNEILHFPKLKTLYLHCNAISTLREVRKLARLPILRHVTLYGNPISKVPHYRNYVIAVLPQIFKLDSVMITKKEVVSSVVYYEYFGEKNQALSSVETLQKRWSERQKMKTGEFTPKKSPDKK